VGKKIGLGKIVNIFIDPTNTIRAKVKLDSGGYIKVALGSEKINEGDIVYVLKDNLGRYYITHKASYSQTLFTYIESPFYTTVAGDFVTGVTLLDIGNDSFVINFDLLNSGSLVVGSDIAYLGVDYANYIVMKSDLTIRKFENGTLIEGPLVKGFSFDKKISFEFLIGKVRDDLLHLDAIQDIGKIIFKSTTPFAEIMGRYGAQLISVSDIYKIKGTGVGSYIELITINPSFASDYLDDVKTSFSMLTEKLSIFGIKTDMIIEFDMVLSEKTYDSNILISFFGKNYYITYFKAITIDGNIIEITTKHIKLNNTDVLKTNTAEMRFDKIFVNNAFYVNEGETSLAILNPKLTLLLRDAVLSVDKYEITATDYIDMHVGNKGFYIDIYGTSSHH